MNNIFYLQLVISFFVGGGFITFLSFLAEKVSKKYSGLVLAFPSTIAISFFFIGLTSGANSVVEIIPSIFIPWGISVLLVSIYPYIAEFLSRKIKNKFQQLFFSLLILIIIWFILIFPFIYYEFENTIFGIIGYLIITYISYRISKLKEEKKPLSLKYKNIHKFIRFIIVGFFISSIVFLSKILNPFWGGVLGMFPVTLISVLSIIHLNYGVKSIYPTIQNLPIGSLSIFIYSLVSIFSFKYYGFIGGTIISYIITIIFTYFLIKIQKN